MTTDGIVRPVDAAGLILLRGRRDAPEILLGRRHSKSAFLPDIYVVPGGRVDPGDHLPVCSALATAGCSRSRNPDGR